jgi:hypothetical protein
MRNGRVSPGNPNFIPIGTRLGTVINPEGQRFIVFG